jgi:hypothetical protein
MSGPKSNDLAMESLRTALKGMDQQRAYEDLASARPLRCSVNAVRAILRNWGGEAWCPGAKVDDLLWVQEPWRWFHTSDCVRWEEAGPDVWRDVYAWFGCGVPIREDKCEICGFTGRPLVDAVVAVDCRVRQESFDEWWKTYVKDKRGQVRSAQSMPRWASRIKCVVTATHWGFIEFDLVTVIAERR